MVEAMASRRSDMPVVVIAIGIIAALLLGEVIVYGSDYSDHRASAELRGDTVSYEVYTNGTQTYSVIISDDGSYSGVDEVYVYYDESYPVGENSSFDRMHFIEELTEMLRIRGVLDVSVMDANDLKNALTADIDSDTCNGKGLVFVSGIIPDTVYMGSEDNILLVWLALGGSVYWHSGLIGQYYGSSDGTSTAVDGYQYLFFGADVLNTEGIQYAYEETGDPYTHALCLQNNDVENGINISMVPETRKSLGTGFTAEGYCSVGIVSYGSGMICVIGGEDSRFANEDMAQVIASGIGPESSIIEMESGEVHGSSEGSLKIGAVDGNLSAFIYMGGYYTVFAQRIDL